MESLSLVSINIVEYYAQWQALSLVYICRPILSQKGHTLLVLVYVMTCTIQKFIAACYLGDFLFNLETEAIYFTETSVTFHYNMWRHIPDKRTLHIHYHKNQESHII
jgi:hypothetical protein